MHLAPKRDIHQTRLRAPGCRCIPPRRERVNFTVESEASYVHVAVNNIRKTVKPASIEKKKKEAKIE